MAVTISSMCSRTSVRSGSAMGSIPMNPLLSGEGHWPAEKSRPFCRNSESRGRDAAKTSYTGLCSTPARAPGG
jgi:hypothetical protein